MILRPFRSSLRELIESRSDAWKVCAEATNGLEAVQRAEELIPDLVIIDLQMPLMDGLAASQKIATSLPKIPILMNTVHKSDLVDSEARKSGIREVISKSDSDSLLKAVARHLGDC